MSEAVKPDELESAMFDDIDRGSLLPLSHYQERFAHLGATVAQVYDSVRAAVDATASSTPLPERIGRYRVLGPFAEGGMGVLFRAHDPDLDRVVLLKTVKHIGASDESRVGRLRNEARLAARIQDPGVCPVLDVVCSGEEVHVVMPLLRGKTLRALLQGVPAASAGPERDALLARRIGTSPGEAPLAAILRFLATIARSVDRLHAAGIVHRDLKPENILVQPDGAPLVLDFGLALEQDSGLEQQTADGALVGTPGVMAPEQILAERDRVGPATDTFALGVLTFETLTGRRPFEAGSGGSLFERVLAGRPTLLRALRPDLPEALEAACGRALERDPARRPASAAAFADALDPARGNTRRLPVRVLALLVLVVVAATTILWLRRGDTGAAERAYRAFFSCWDAYDAGQEPDPADLAVVVGFLPEEAARAEFFRTPLSPGVRDRFLAHVNRATRVGAGEAELRITEPIGRIAEPHPQLVIHSRLPLQQSLALRVVLQQTETGTTHEFVQRGKGAEWRIDTPEGLALSPGTWRCTVALDPASHGAVAASVEPASVVFEVTPEVARAATSARLAPTGDPTLDALLRADALARGEFWAAALEALGQPPAETVPAALRARHWALRGECLGHLQRRAPLQAAFATWQTLVREHGPGR